MFESVSVEIILIQKMEMLVCAILGFRGGAYISR